MTQSQPVLFQLSHLSSAFAWAQECGNVTKVTEKGSDKIVASECCPTAPMLIASENATACEAAAGVGAYFLVALYALLLTAFAPALLVIGGLLCMTKVGQELFEAGYLFPIALLNAIAHIFLTIAAHCSDERVE